MSKARSLATFKKRELFPMFYAKGKKGEERNAGGHNRHGLAGTTMLADRRTSTAMQHLMGSSTSGKCNSRLSLMKFDKFGRMKYLDRLDVTKVSRLSASNLKPSSASVSAMQPQCRNMKYAEGEVQRQMGKAITMLRLQKLSEIANYTQTDNVVLQRQTRLMRGFAGLPEIYKKQ